MRQDGFPLARGVMLQDLLSELGVPRGLAPGTRGSWRFESADVGVSANLALGEDELDAHLTLIPASGRESEVMVAHVHAVRESDGSYLASGMITTRRCQWREAAYLFRYFGNRLPFRVLRDFRGDEP